MTRPHAIGIVGAGEVVQRFYLPVIRERPHVSVRSICSGSRATAEATAALFGRPDVAVDAGELVRRSDVETVFVCTPPYAHREIAEQALAFGKNVLVEKPVCATYAELQSLLAAATRSHGILAASFNNAFREENEWLARQVASGSVGELEFLDLEWLRTKPRPPKSWMTQPALSGGGGVLADLGSHLLRIAMNLLGSRRQFLAHATAGRRASQPDAIEDTAVATLLIDGCVQVSIRVGWGMALPEPARVNIRAYGSRGVLSNRDYVGPTSDGYGRLIDRFLAHVELGSRVDLTRVENTMRVLHALYRSIGSGTVVAGELVG